MRNAEAVCTRVTGFQEIGAAGRPFGGFERAVAGYRDTSVYAVSQ
jgi:hypothetical protein